MDEGQRVNKNSLKEVKFGRKYTGLKMNWTQSMYERII